MIKCVLELGLRWTRNCIIYAVSTNGVLANPATNPPVPTTTTSATLQMNIAKLYVSNFQNTLIKDLKEQYLGTNTDLK